MFERVKNIQCPVKIVHGTADKSVPIEHTRKLIKNLKNAELIELEGADHAFSKEEDSLRILNMIIDYFKE